MHFNKIRNYELPVHVALSHNFSFKQNSKSSALTLTRCLGAGIFGTLFMSDGSLVSSLTMYLYIDIFAMSLTV